MINLYSRRSLVSDILLTHSTHHKFRKCLQPKMWARFFLSVAKIGLAARVNVSADFVIWDDWRTQCFLRNKTKSKVKNGRSIEWDCFSHWVQLTDVCRRHEIVRNSHDWFMKPHTLETQTHYGTQAISPETTSNLTESKEKNDFVCQNGIIWWVLADFNLFTA